MKEYEVMFEETYCVPDEDTVYIKAKNKTEAMGKAKKLLKKEYDGYCISYLQEVE